MGNTDTGGEYSSETKIAVSMAETFQKLITVCRRVVLATTLFVGGWSTSWAAWSVTPNPTPVASGSYTRLWTVQDTVTFGKVNDIVVDASGNVYTTGYRNAVSNSGGIGTGFDLVVAKHDSRGNLLWSTTYNQAGAGYDEGIALALDSNGDVYVAGRTHNGIDYDIVTLKFSSADGTQVWADISGAQGADPSSALDDQPIGIVIGPGDKIYVAGISTNAQGNTDFITLRYNTGGNSPWSRVYDNGGDDTAVAIATDPAGNVIVLGTSAGTSTPDLATVKYDAVNGSTVWLKRYDSSGGARDDAADVAVDAAGDVYVTSTSWTGGNRDFLTLKYSGIDGSELWLHTYNSGGNLRDTAAALALDPSGAYVYVTGVQIGTTTDYDLATVKYASDTGNPLWVRVDDIGSGDAPVGLAVDAAGEVFVAAARNTIGSRDMVISQYDPDGVKAGAFVYDNGADEAPSGLALGQDNEGLTTIHIAQGCDRVALRIGSCTLTPDYRLVKFGAVRPDLVVDSVTGPAIAPAGGAITVNTVVRNVKDSTAGSLADSGAFTVSMYLVPSGTSLPIQNQSDLHILGSRAVSALASGASDAADSVLSVPPVSGTFPEGNYNLMARVDSADTVTERDENNNDLINTGLTVQLIDPPNLRPSAVTGPASALPVSPINIDYTIDNTRAVTAPSFDAALYLTADGVLGNSDDVLLGTFTVGGGIAGNGSVTGTVSVAAPNTTPAGDYSVAIVVDPTNAVLESDEGDNQLIGSAIRIDPLPDLTLTDVSGPLGAQANQTISVSTTVLATTADVGNSFNVDLYLSTDQTISAADDISLGQRTVTAPLLAGQSNTASVSVTVPGSVSQGVYYLGAIVDPVVDPVNQPYGSVTEDNETNNTRAAAGTISIGLASGGDPDLVITDVTGPSSAALGQTIAVDTTVENVLAADINSPFDVGIYLSTDPQITSSDLLLGSYTLSSLLGNSVAQSQTQVTIPQGSTLESIVWANVIGNITVNGSTLTCNSGNWTAGAASQQVLGGDGWLEVTHANSIAFAFGVSSGAAERTDPGYTTIDFAFVITGLAYTIQSDGNVIAGPTRTGANDVFRIERTGGNLTFKQNGAAVFTTTVAATSPLFADVSCGGTVTSGNGAIVSNGQISIQQVSSGATYYLGAIADSGAAITEVNEANNSQVQTGVSGAPGNITIAVTSGDGGGHGGGAFGIYEILLGLMAGLWIAARRRTGRRLP